MRIDRTSEDRSFSERIDRLSERIDRIREDRSITKKKCAPRGLIVNFEIGHDGLFEGGLIRGERAY